MSSTARGLTVGRHTFDIDGVVQAFEVAGRGPVCVVHSGGPGVNSQYLRMPQLEQHLTMVYADPVGTGRSGLLPGGEYFVPTYARFLKTILGHLDQVRPLVLGHSHGGFVALELAAQSPGLLGGLIAYDTAPSNNAELWEEATRQMAAFVQRWPDRQEAVRAGHTWHAYRVTGDAKIVDRASHLDFRSGIQPAYFADFRRTIAQRGPQTNDITFDPARKNGEWDARERLGSIDAPTLIVSGAYDFICPPRWAQELQDGIPNARVLDLADSGHFGHIEQPDEFTCGVLDFVRTSL
jgi:pimeloyl-ACP methyl ester carboxylesterase